jgi:hypothetical protein
MIYLIMKQGILIIPYDILTLLIIFAIFAILYINLLQSLRAKKDILIKNIEKKIRSGVKHYSNSIRRSLLFDEYVIKDANAYAAYYVSSNAPDSDILKNLDSPPDSDILKNLDSLISEKKINEEYVISYVKLKAYEIYYLGQNIHRLHKSRMRKLEKLDEDIDTIYTLKLEKSVK